MGVSPWMNATVGPSEARRAKEGASADSAEERKETTGVNPWKLHLMLVLGVESSCDDTGERYLSTETFESPPESSVS